MSFFQHSQNDNELKFVDYMPYRIEEMMRYLKDSSYKVDENGIKMVKIEKELSDNESEEEIKTRK